MDNKLLALIIIYAVNAIISLGFGAFILLKAKKSTLSITYSLMSFLVFVWMLLWAFAFASTNPEQNRILMSYGFLVSAFIAALYAHFLFALIGQADGKRIVIRTFYAAASLIVLVSLIFPEQFAASSTPKLYFNYYINAGILHIIYSIFFIFAVAYPLFHLIKAFKNYSGEQRSQMRLIIIGSLAAFAAGSSAFFPAYNIMADPLFSGFAGIYIIFYAFAVFKYHLMGVKPVVKKAFVYSVLIAAISGIMAGVSFLTGWLSENIPGFSPWIVPLFIGFITFIAGNLFWKKSMEVEKIKYEFVTVAAHKLRTPLTRVKWGVSALQEKGEKDKEKKRLISDIGETNNLLIELVNQLLVVSKEEDDKYLCKKEPARLVEIAKKVVYDFRDEIKKKNIKLTFKAAKDLPETALDKERIKSAIRILLENAITYARPTGGKININIKKEKKYLLFTIEDNGIGIEKEDQPYIFSKFFRTHKAYLTETEGAGVGLFLAKSIIERCRGKLGVESGGEGKGSVFWFKLPINR